MPARQAADAVAHEPRAARRARGTSCSASRRTVSSAPGASPRRSISAGAALERLLVARRAARSSAARRCGGPSTVPRVREHQRDLVQRAEHVGPPARHARPASAPARPARPPTVRRRRMRPRRARRRGRSGRPPRCGRGDGTWRRRWRHPQRTAPQRPTASPRPGSAHLGHAARVIRPAPPLRARPSCSSPLAAGCGGGGSGKPADELVAESVAKTSAVKSFHLVIDVENVGDVGLGAEPEVRRRRRARPRQAEGQGRRHLRRHLDQHRADRRRQRPTT